MLLLLITSEHDSIELDRPPSVYTAAKLMSTLIYRNKDNLMGAFCTHPLDPESFLRPSPTIDIMSVTSLTNQYYTHQPIYLQPA